MKLRHLRLLPCVVLVGALLLVLKGSGLVHEANAQAATGEPEEAAAIAPPTPPPIKDFADDQSAVTSAAEEDLLTNLAKRRGELDARASQLDMQTQILAATEARVDNKIAQLKQLQAQIANLLTSRDAAQEKQIAALVKTYSAMKPKDAARIFESLGDDVLVPVAQEMKSDTLAPVLAAMSPDAAQKLTVKLAGRLVLPDTANPAATPAVAPGPAAPPAAALASQATAAPAPKPPSGG